MDQYEKKRERFEELGLKVDENQQIHFPTLCKCLACHGFRSVVTHGDIEPPTKQEAYEIALIQHGYRMAKWEGKRILSIDTYPEKCTCTCKHQWKEIRTRGFLHTVKCEKCGKTLTYDSSG